MCLGVPGKVLETFEANGMKMGKVDFGGVLRESCLAYLPDVAVGDYVIVHAGFAISKVDEEEARQTMAMLKEMDMLSPESAEDTNPG
jgi:hydrogenase expression/formation protein HypC